MGNVLSYLIRVFLIYIFTYFATRVMSKKAIAQMTAYEMSGIIILTTIAAEPLVTKVTAKAILGVGFMSILIFVTSRLALLNKFSMVLEHTPTILINQNKIDLEALKSVGLSLNQLKGLLRQQGYDKIADVEVAILEPQGNISVIPKSQSRPIKTSDLKVATSYEGLTIPLIMDGVIIERNLEHIKQSKDWLLRELQLQGIKNFKTEVILAEMDTSSKVSIFKKV